MKTKQLINIFFVDDDPIYLKMLENNLKQSKHYTSKVYTYTTGEECIENMHIKPDVVVLDYYLNGVNKDAMDGIQTLKQIKIKNSNTQIVVLSGQDKIDIAVDCIKNGAFDYIPKSESAFVRTQNAINNILENKKLSKEAHDQKFWFRIAGSILVIILATFLTLSFLYPSS
jgi:two-component system, OmpR family, response regulator